MEYDITADSVNAISSGVGTVTAIIELAFIVLIIVSMWKIFKKAGQPGWAVLIPFYGTYIEFKIAYNNGWRFLLLLIPIAGIVFYIMFLFKLAKVFGKGIGFGFGLLFLTPIFIPILGLGNAEYVG